MITAEELTKIELQLSPLFVANIDKEIWDLILLALDKAGYQITKKKDGKKIVTEWLLDLWINHPIRMAQPGGDWLNRMPQRQEIDELIKAIDD